LDERDWLACRQCVAGDSGACGELLKRHEQKIAQQMWRFSRDRDAHAELVQEVMVQAYLSLHRYRATSAPFDHWLSRIATRVGYRFWRQQARRRKAEPLEGLEVAAPPSAASEAEEAARTLHALLAQLPPKDRLVLTLMYFEECGVEAIADRMGWNAAATKMRLYRARRRLRQIIERKELKEFLLGAGYGSA
jgi:RNA polymerase sigma-70 factor, ECF subfamily